MTETKKPLLEFDKVELAITQTRKIDELFDFHKFACSKASSALKLRPIEFFEASPDHAMIYVTLSGTRERIAAGMAVLFDESDMAVEMGSLFSSRNFRGYGFGQMMADAMIVKWWDDNNSEKYTDAKMIARVKYGNTAPLALLRRAGFKVIDIVDEKIHYVLTQEAPRKAAIRLYDAIIKHDVVVDDAIFAAIFATIKNAKSK